MRSLSPSSCFLPRPNSLALEKILSVCVYPDSLPVAVRKCAGLSRVAQVDDWSSGGARLGRAGPGQARLEWTGVDW